MVVSPVFRVKDTRRRHRTASRFASHAASYVIFGLPRTPHRLSVLVLHQDDRTAILRHRDRRPHLPLLNQQAQRGHALRRHAEDGALVAVVIDKFERLRRQRLRIMEVRSVGQPAEDPPGSPLFQAGA